MQALRIKGKIKFAYIWQNEWGQIKRIKFERMQKLINFVRDTFPALVILVEFVKDLHWATLRGLNNKYYQRRL